VFRVEYKAAREGFTLVEILITIAILGVLLMIAVSNLRGFNEKYKVEAETKQLYADLMDARGRAMQRNRMFFVRFAGTGPGYTGYATYEDTNNPPDGNGSWDNTADTMVTSVTVAHTITTALPGSVNAFQFNRNGIASATGDIRFSSTANPDYDCITILPTRIKMGQYSGGGCVEK
jgi:prepilin-type N-terminal cleavage/methylation domain-containing protein